MWLKHFALMKICVSYYDGTIDECSSSFKPLSIFSGVHKAKLMGVCNWSQHLIAPDCYKKLSSKKIKINYCSCSQFCFPSPFNCEKTVRFPWSDFYKQFWSILIFNSLGQSMGVLVFLLFPLWQLWLDTLASFEMRPTVTIDIVREHRIVFSFCVDIY